MRAILMVLFLLTTFTPAFAWSLFGPKNEHECILKYQKIAKCNRASAIINMACSCKFNGSQVFVGKTLWGCYVNNNFAYSLKAVDCILENIGDAQNDIAASSVLRTCTQKYP